MDSFGKELKPRRDLGVVESRVGLVYRANDWTQQRKHAKRRCGLPLELSVHDEEGARP
jgi:hypothetical protein